MGTFVCTKIELIYVYVPKWDKDEEMELVGDVSVSVSAALFWLYHLTLQTRTHTEKLGALITTAGNSKEYWCYVQKRATENL